MLSREKLKETVVGTAVVGAIGGVIVGGSVYALISTENQTRRDLQQIRNQGFDIITDHPLSGNVVVQAGRCALQLDYHQHSGERPIQLEYHAAGKTFTITEPQQLPDIAPRDCY